jgi:hypothetical protein
VEDLLDEDWTMEAMMMQGWTLSLVFGVGRSDIDTKRKGQVWAWRCTFQELDVMVGLATQPVKDLRLALCKDMEELVEV